MAEANAPAAQAPPLDEEPEEQAFPDTLEYEARRQYFREKLAAMFLHKELGIVFGTSRALRNGIIEWNREKLKTICSEAFIDGLKAMRAWPWEEDFSTHA